MNFDLGEDELLLRENVRDFCRREIEPYVSQWDEHGQFPLETVRKLGELGLLGLEVPEAEGGAGLSTVAAVAVLEEIAAASAALALSLGAHNALVVGHMLRSATAEQRASWLHRLASGETLGAWALTEPTAGSDAASITTTARREADGFVLDGRKSLVTHGAAADVVIVIASTDLSAGSRGLSAFIVEKGAAGLAVERRVETLGVRACAPVDLRLSNVRVGADALLGGEGGAFSDVLAVLDRGRINVAALACGVLRAALAAARKYAGERKQFGKPIAEFQAVQWKIANMATDLSAAWLLTMRAADCCQSARAFRSEAAHAKLFASRAAVRGCSDALQVHGGFGYTREFPVERYLRDARVCEIAEGTTQILELVIGRDLERRYTET